jgi:hypothetical protein
MSNNNYSDNSNSDEDKYYDENYSMNVTYEEFETCNNINNLVPNTRLRENENNNTNPDGGAGSSNIQRTSSNIAGLTSNLTQNITNNLLVHRESSLNEYSNFNLGMYTSAEYTGNVEVMSESTYMNRNFELHLDEIFENLTYLITTEK